jgi:heavy metal sensor kinase
MKSWPLRWKIAGWSALASALALLAFGTIVAVDLYTEQVEMIDTRLATSAGVLFAEQPVPAGEASAELFARLAAGPRARHDSGAALSGFAVRRAQDGAVLHVQPSSLARVLADRAAGARPRFFNATIEGERVRIGEFAQGDTALALAAPLSPAEESVLDLLGSMSVALPVGLIVVAGGSWWIARRSLRPIADITAAAASISADRLGERLPLPANDDEIGEHVRVLNGMFDRLQRGFEQARRFSADAAHELRTPLTILRGQIESALRAATRSPGHERLLVELLEETTGLQKIADNLLLLSRFDSGKASLEREVFDFGALLADAREDAELLASPHGIVVRSEIATSLQVDGDRVMLRRVALNLIDNAVKFNRPGGEVRLTLRRERGEIVWSAGNTGAGIPADRRGDLFERFYRADADRNRASGGAGLGLSLCREIVHAHGGAIVLARSEADWTEFVVRLPGGRT